ncbi:MAG: IclR family transcriptional regulator [Betaproteobacteria bacterium]|nr:IclR family transcriptional regulator [Betaproteobacteria bacterium]
MPKKEDRIPATLRAFAVMEALARAERPVSLTDLAEATRLPKPTVYRMLAMLEEARLAMREPGLRRYAPGPRLSGLARDVMLSSGFRAARHAILDRLVAEIGETCNFTMLDVAGVIYLDRVEAAWPLRINLSSGSRVPLHCTASGKLLVAMLPRPARERLVAQLALTPFTENTITARKRFEAELTRIRAQKFATDNEEFHAGLVCVSVPVQDARKRTCAALAVHAPMSRMPLERALGHLPTLRRAAAAMSATFG